MNRPLALKDIHLPDPVGWWPPAVGWWLLLIMIPLFAALIWWLYKRVTRQTALKSAAQLLGEIREGEATELQQLQQLSAWFRRVAMTVSGRENIAGLTGDAWLAELDRSVEGRPFSEGVGRCLVEGLYRKEGAEGIDIPALIALCEVWLKGQKR